MILLPFERYRKKSLPGAGRGDLTQQNLIEALATRSNQASLDLNCMQYKKAAQLRLASVVFAVRGVISIQASQQFCEWTTRGSHAAAGTLKETC